MVVGDLFGLRKEWNADDGSVVGIDIAQFDSDSQARNASEWMDEKTYFFNNRFDLDDPGSIELVIENCKKFGITKNISFVGSKGNLAVHFYTHNPAEVDADFVYDIVSQLAGHISNF